MQKMIVSLAVLIFVGFSAVVLAKNEPLTQEQKGAYALGQQLGGDLKDGGVEVDIDMLAAGIKDAYAGTSLLDDTEIASAMENLQREMMEKQMAQREKAAKENLREGQAFLSENAQKDGVETTESGLQYEVIEKGSGKTPTPESTVTVHYRGTLIDGTEFDSSYRRGEPATFPVNGVIAGWTEALQLMSEGAKYKLYIPADLAYGERGAGQAIGPNETLIFDVELISVK
jgi:FKBP-type peptidyl-prolyl cis-trans isomerase FklB